MSTPEQSRLAAAIAALAYENPFLPSRIEAEREILGDAFVADTTVWSRDLRQASRANVAAIADLAARYRVQGIPNFAVFAAGNLQFQQAGLVDADTMKSWLAKAWFAQT